MVDLFRPCSKIAFIDEQNLQHPLLLHHSGMIGACYVLLTHVDVPQNIKLAVVYGHKVSYLNTLPHILLYNKTPCYNELQCKPITLVK